MNTEEVIKALQSHVDKTIDLYREAVDLLAAAVVLIKDQSTPLPDLVDIGFLLREMDRHHDEVRKEAGAHKDLTGKLVAFRKITATMNEENPNLVVRGKLASGSPDMRIRTTIPKKGTPEFETLCRHFGMENTAIDGALFSPHYVRLGDYLSMMHEAGEQLPPGVKLSQPIYSTVFRKKG